MTTTAEPLGAPARVTRRHGVTATPFTFWVGVLALFGLGWLLVLGLLLSPEDVTQGDSVRIMYIHVPTVWVAYLAFGVTAALLRRERTGRGGELDVALFMAALLAQNNSLVRVTSVDGPVQADALVRLRRLRAAGRSFEEQSAAIPSARTAGMLNVYFRTYPTKDDVIGIACVSPALQRALMETLDLADDDAGAFDEE